MAQRTFYLGCDGDGGAYIFNHKPLWNETTSRFIPVENGDCEHIHFLYEAVKPNRLVELAIPDPDDDADCSVPRPQTQTHDPNPLDDQVGGDHYNRRAIQPIEYIEANKLGFCEGNAIKYITRHAEKGGKDDLLKAIHYLHMLIAFRYHSPEKQPEPHKEG